MTLLLGLCGAVLVLISVFQSMVAARGVLTPAVYAGSARGARRTWRDSLRSLVAAVAWLGLAMFGLLMLAYAGFGR
jgi:hypothetical protein